MNWLFPKMWAVFGYLNFFRMFLPHLVLFFYVRCLSRTIFCQLMSNGMLVKCVNIFYEVDFTRSAQCKSGAPPPLSKFFFARADSVSPN